MRIYLIGLGLVGAVSAQATTLTLTGVADDYFDAYISTSDVVQGTLFLQQTSTWQSQGVSGSVNLMPNQTHYLHIRARDAFGAPSMFIAEATLSDANFQFANLTQNLVTNPNDWNLSLTGFGSGYFTPVDLGANGTGPWGNHSSISPTARRLWSQQTAGEHYFSVEIQAVPEPASLLVFGAIGLIAAKRKKSSK